MEPPCIAHRGRYRRCRNEADAGDGFEPLAFRAAAVPAQQLGVNLSDLYDEGFDELRDQQQRLPGELGHQVGTGVEHAQQVA